jgi:hypothetical protein
MKPNPLSNQKIRDLARSGKPYAHALQGILGGETR